MNGPIGTTEIDEICDLRDDAYRNRWITYAYWRISQRLWEHIGDNTSWCTFSTWSSRTIGESLRLDKATRRIEELIYDEESSISLRDHPELLRLQYRMTTRDDGRAQLALAIGNRVIFHEIGTAVVQLLDWIDAKGVDDLDGWRTYREINVQCYDDNLLFPRPETGPEELWNGLDCYYRATGAQSADEQAELVLQGNIWLGAFEQRRADRLLKVALEPFPRRYVRREFNPDGNTVFTLKVEGSRALEGPLHWRIISEQFAELMTRYVMALGAPLFSWTIRHLRLGHGLPRPDDGNRFYPPALETLDDDVLRELFSAWDDSDGVPERCAAQNWTRLEDRMNFIVNLFRAGLQDPNLYRELPDADLRALKLDLSDGHLNELRQFGDNEIDPWIEGQAEESDMNPQQFLDHLVDVGFAQLLKDDKSQGRQPGLPKWANRAKLWAGQAFFRAHGLEIGAALFSASLPMSYTAKRGAQVLTSTADLADPTKARRRLAETGQMLLDTMASDDSSKRPLDRETHAYQAARGVRLFHAAVRHALRNIPPPEQPWDEADLGVPVNQEDLVGTLAAFTVAVIGSLDEMGVTVSVQDRDAYFHLWLVIGDLLGIDYKRLFREGEAPAPDEQPLSYADMQLVSRVIFDRHSDTSAEGEQLMGALLHVSEDSMPRGLGRLPRALTRRLIGDRYADMLHIPPAGATRLLTTALRPINAMISPYVPRNALGGLANRFTREAYGWWINEGRGQRPPWRMKETVPSSWREAAPTRASRHLADVADRIPFVPASLRRRLSTVLRPNAP